MNAASAKSDSSAQFPNRFELRVLGTFEALVAGTTIKLAPMPRRLLAALTLRSGEPLSANLLIDSLWAGAAPQSATSVLRVYVSQLRRALPPGRLVTERAGYRLFVDEGELDADQFEHLLADGRRTLADGNDRLAATLFGRALALWKGEAFAGLNHELFVRDEAMRLEELRLQCVEAQFEAELRLGRHDHLLADLERLVAEYPVRERLRVQLMTALYRSGRQADALARYREGRSYLDTALGLEPGVELRELERKILGHDAALTVPSAGRTAGRRVPPPRTPTIGRSSELRLLGRLLLDSRTRLVSLVGPGGVGKTRLAVQLASDLGEQLTDGALLVDLTPLTDPSDVVPAFGRALGLREGESTGWEEAIGAELAGRELLVVLDNFEHVVDGAHALVPIMDAAPRVTLLVTSRRVLRLSAERVVDVLPLELSAARELLASRAAASGVGVDVDSAPFGEVCERLDGIPLAIELAAPWFRSRSPGELLRLLDSRLEALAVGARDAPERHRTMRAAIDWSFGLLDDNARHLLGRVSLFRTPFTIEAATAVNAPAGVGDSLDALVEASLVYRSGAGYALLEVVREYGLGLESSDEAGQDLHARYFGALAAQAEPELSGPDQGEWLERLDAVHDDLRRALDRLGELDQSTLRLQVASSLGRFWYVRGYLTEGLSRLNAAIEDAPTADSALVAKALRTASALAVLKGDYARARTLAERALLLYHEISDETGIDRTLSKLGAILLGLGELQSASDTLDECITAAESLGDSRLIALARNNRGDVALSRGELEVAADQFQQSLVLLREADDVANVARALYNLGAVEIERGRSDLAQPLLVEALTLSTSVDDKEDIAWCLLALAAVGARAGRAEDATTVLGFADAFLGRIGAAIKPAEQRLYDRTLSELRAALDRTELNAFLAAGRDMDDGEALNLAASL